jgi:Ca-activated chloride channel family protein
VSELDGGEVGSGHSVIALFEIEPVFATPQPVTNMANLAKINVRYKLPNDTLQRYTTYRCPYNVTSFASLPPTYRFASSVAMFAALLKDSKYAQKYSWSEVIKLATESEDAQDAVQKEFIEIVEKAKKVYGRERKRKKII